MVGKFFCLVFTISQGFVITPEILNELMVEIEGKTFFDFIFTIVRVFLRSQTTHLLKNLSGTCYFAFKIDSEFIRKFIRGKNRCYSISLLKSCSNLCSGFNNMLGAYKKKSIPTVPAFEYQDPEHLFDKRSYDSFVRD